MFGYSIAGEYPQHIITGQTGKAVKLNSLALIIPNTLGLSQSWNTKLDFVCVDSHERYIQLL